AGAVASGAVGLAWLSSSAADSSPHSLGSAASARALTETTSDASSKPFPQILDFDPRIVRTLLRATRPSCDPVCQLPVAQNIVPSELRTVRKTTQGRTKVAEPS